MIDRQDGQVLDKGAAVKHIEHLRPEADPKQWFSVMPGVLEQHTVGAFALFVGGGAGFLAHLTVRRGIDIGGAAGQKDAVAGLHEPQERAIVEIERTLDRLAATFGYSPGEGRPV